MLTLLISTLTSLVCVYSNPIVQIGSTEITGTNIGAANKVEFFGGTFLWDLDVKGFANLSTIGIPFARPPVGELRLTLPVLLTTFDVKIFDARDFGPGCLQAPPPPGPGVSDDCLTLNVYRPSGLSSKSKFPVLVWIYGGGFVVGSSSFYNATDLVARSASRGTPIIFVSINYRAGPFGFPQGIEAGQRNITNLGLHDQLTALEWIQENIGNFGGDKTKVTVAGESAGAGAIVYHFLEPRIKGLARAAILESTGSGTSFTPDRNEANWQEYVAAIPACAAAVGTNNTFDCIRSASTAALVQALVDTNLLYGNGSFRPVIDGPGGLIVDRPSQIVPQGNLPTLLGTNLDEGALFTPQTTDSTAEIEDALTAMFLPSVVSPEKLGATIASTFTLYPDIPALGSPFGTGNDTFGLSSQYKRYAAILGDIMFQSSKRTLAQQLAESGLPAFVYHFTDPDAIPVAEFSPAVAAPNSLGSKYNNAFIVNRSRNSSVPHTSELPYVFGSLINKTPSAAALSVIMQNYWISFVNDLDPNDSCGQKRPHWEQYTLKNQVLLELNGKHISRAAEDFRAAQIALWQDNADVLHR
ncbi:hypothetical protein HYPSUDRAFT_34618 [Hypholoma sublateritium FD-334 SS-4]|uniref:Carboxylic ester hydrolase n=1 Tax=Hypholoma sublateritium (strain FD-334 SS-4) TaxID=945553 RepID=A0A0D2PBJ8_HYPSF|nr:hypothetical protein HYPSUDRAFT_34618 [Hypholoma sublateritium FD-334 SS-4]